MCRTRLLRCTTLTDGLRAPSSSSATHVTLLRARALARRLKRYIEEAERARAETGVAAETIKRHEATVSVLQRELDALKARSGPLDQRRWQR